MIESKNRFKGPDMQDQEFFDQVLKQAMEQFIKDATSEEPSWVHSWPGYFNAMGDGGSLDEMTITEVLLNWTSAEHVTFIRSSKLMSLIASLEKLLLNHSEALVGYDVERSLRQISCECLVVSLQLRLLEMGIKPSNLDDFIAWREAAKPTSEIVQDTFQRCVLRGEPLPRVAETVSA